MTEITLVAIGSLPSDLLGDLAEFLAEATGYPCAAAAVVIDPTHAHDPRRAQYDCRRLFPVLEELAHTSGRMVVGVADVDLYSAIFTFVFGESKLGGTAAMVSVHRLRPVLYGLPDDPDLVRRRAERETLHEIGHLFGLVHCRSADCVMRFSGSVEEVDLKQSRFCDDCRAYVDGPECAHPLEERAPDGSRPEVGRQETGVSGRPDLR